MSDRWLRWIMLALVACSHQARLAPSGSNDRSGDQPGPDETAPPVVVSAAEAVVWTQRASGSISHRIWGDTDSPADPILAVASHGDTVAMLIATGSHVVRIVRGDDKPVDIPIQVGNAWRLGTIALDDRVARVAIAVVDGLTTATVDLANGRAIDSVTLRARTDRYRIVFVGRAPDGWIAAGYRIRARDQTDAVAWFVGDGATVLPEPFVIAKAAMEHQADWVDGMVAPDGSAIVLITVPQSGPVASKQFAAIRHGDTWTVLDALQFSGGTYKLGRSGTNWVVEQLMPNHGAPVLHVINAVTGALRTLDGAWSGDGRARVQMFRIGEDLAVFGGDAIHRVGGGFTTGDRPSDGAIYEVATGNVRPFPEPTPDPRYKPVADPPLVLPLDDKLCLLGGTAYPVDGSRSSKIHGAACVDPATATWRWLASPPVPPGCKAIDTAASTGFVLCMTQHVWNEPPSREWSGRQVFGPWTWTLWRLAVAPSANT